MKWSSDLSYRSVSAEHSELRSDHTERNVLSRTPKDRAQSGDLPAWGSQASPLESGHTWCVPSIDFFTNFLCSLRSNSPGRPQCTNPATRDQGATRAHLSASTDAPDGRLKSPMMPFARLDREYLPDVRLFEL